MEAGSPTQWATKQDLADLKDAAQKDMNDLKDRMQTRLGQMDEAREAARLEHSQQHKDIYEHVDRVGTKLEQKIDDWRKEQNGRIGTLETWKIQLDAIMSVFTKGIRNRTLLVIVLILVMIGGYLWKQTSNSLCELRNNSIHRVNLAYLQGRITEEYKKKQVQSLKQIAC